MKRAMARQAEAEREKRAKIINAEGEHLAAASLGEASDIMMTHPIALQLRNLQTLIELGVDKNTTVVFPAPLMSTIGELGSFLARETEAAKDTRPPDRRRPHPGPAPDRHPGHGQHVGRLSPSRTMSSSHVASPEPASPPPAEACADRAVPRVETARRWEELVSSYSAPGSDALLNRVPDRVERPLDVAGRREAHRIDALRRRQVSVAGGVGAASLATTAGAAAVDSVPLALTAELDGRDRGRGRGRTAVAPHGSAGRPHGRRRTRHLADDPVRPVAGRPGP